MVAEDPKLAQLSGVNVRRVYYGVFAFEGAAVAFAAGMVAPRTPILTSMGFDEVIMTFVVVVFGGIGSVKGSYVAGRGAGAVHRAVRRPGVAGLHHGGGLPGADRAAGAAPRRAGAGAGGGVH